MWDPYQYIETVSGLGSLTGMDVKLAKLYASTVGIPLDLPERQWKMQLEDLKEGTRDVATGAAESDERKKFGFYSIPFRNEEDAIFLLKKCSRELSFSTPQELMDLIRAKGLKLAVCDGTYYASKELMAFINDP